jgi:thiamine biosynthesis lipoprotein
MWAGEPHEQAYASGSEGNATRATERRVLVERCARLMATDVSVQLAAAPEDEAAAHEATDACMSWLAEVDARLSRFRAESELCRLNAAGGAWFRASDLLYAAVERAVWAARVSGGRFDPAILVALEAAGYDRDFAQIAHREIGGIAALRAHGRWAPGGWRHIELDARGRRIRLREGVRIDLGGIAKGWAADVALERYCARFPGALINVGGDLRLRGGPHHGQPWSVGIRDPRRETLHQGEDVGQVAAPSLVMLTFSRGGLATSGAARRWWLRDGQSMHHLIDPRDGSPMRLWLDGERACTSAEPLIATATALAATSAQAEVAAKVALLRGYPAALHAVEQAWARYGAVGPSDAVDAGVALVLLLGTGEVVYSANIFEYLATWGTDDAALPMRIAGTAPLDT